MKAKRLPNNKSLSRHPRRPESRVTRASVAPSDCFAQEASCPLLRSPTHLLLLSLSLISLSRLLPRVPCCHSRQQTHSRQCCELRCCSVPVPLPLRFSSLFAVSSSHPPPPSVPIHHRTSLVRRPRDPFLFLFRLSRVAFFLAPLPLPLFPCSPSLSCPLIRLVREKGRVFSGIERQEDVGTRDHMSMRMRG